MSNPTHLILGGAGYVGWRWALRLTEKNPGLRRDDSKRKRFVYFRVFRA